MRPVKPEEIALIQSMHNAAIIAPAGHGKTEMITELAEQLPGKKLILTHTNAGVRALTTRLNKKNIKNDKYNLFTISSFCMRWNKAYPATSGLDPNIEITNSQFYNSQYTGAGRIFSHKWARDVLQNTYSHVIVDEYQDCIIDQHKIFVNINSTIPVYIFGDPLQSIFGWAGKPVSWNNLEFKTVCVETSPHRWNNFNPELGEYLTSVRTTLLPALHGESVWLCTKPNGKFIKRVSQAEAWGDKLLSEINRFQSVVYLTKWPKPQCSFSQQSGGVFQNDEPQNLTDLYQYARSLDSDDGFSIAKTIFDFIANCATKINAELGSYKVNIEKRNLDFSRISKHPDFGDRIQELCRCHSHEQMLSVLEWIKSNSTFRLYRRELFTELIRSIRFAMDKQISIFDAAQQIRMGPNNQHRYTGFKKLASRAVLSKGLEFECVIIDLSEKYTATEMYVAMTRAMKVIYFITDQDYVLLDAH